MTEKDKEDRLLKPKEIAGAIIRADRELCHHINYDTCPEPETAKLAVYNNAIAQAQLDKDLEWEAKTAELTRKEIVEELGDIWAELQDYLTPSVGSLLMVDRDDLTKIEIRIEALKQGKKIGGGKP